jgi:hypothetical protein
MITIQETIMPFETSELQAYLPSAALKTEASQALKDALFEYKQLFYGLRVLMWHQRDKRGIFTEALSKGELNCFKIAPGVRDENGNYTKDEWDWDGVNRYLWQSFSERFEAAFSLEQQARNFKDIKQAIYQLCEYALTHYGHQLICIEDETPNLQDINFDVVHKGIRIQLTRLHDDCYTLQLSREEAMLALTLERVEQNWEAQITATVITATGKQAKEIARMWNWAAEISLRFTEFLANPEAFLQMETAGAKARNIQRMRHALLKLNKDDYERKKAQQQQPDSNSLPFASAPETQTGSQTRSSDTRVEANPYEKLAGPVKIIQLSAQELSTPHLSAKERRRNQLEEAQAWLEANAHHIPELIE